MEAGEGWGLGAMGEDVEIMERYGKVVEYSVRSHDTNNLIKERKMHNQNIGGKTENLALLVQTHPT